MFFHILSTLPRYKNNNNNNNNSGWNVDLCQSGNEINIFVEKIRSSRFTECSGLNNSKNKLGRLIYFFRKG